MKKRIPGAGPVLRAGVLKAVLAASLMASARTVCAQGVTTEEMLQRHRFVFIAEWATGNNSVRQQLSPTYELMITSDSVDGRLPFYGRVYAASDAYTMANEGFTIRSRLQRYELRKRRNESWELVVEAQAGNNVQKLTFSIFRDGSARLFINSAWRDAMYYDGRIAASQTP